MAFVIEGQTCAEVWERGLKYLVENGKFVTSTYGPVLECLDISLAVRHPADSPRISMSSPKLRLPGNLDTWIADNPRIKNWEGINQIEEIVRILSADPLSRRAVVTVWNPKEDLKIENAHGLVALFFTIRENRLNLTSVFRTTDAWMCNWTLAGISELQESVYKEIRRKNKMENLSMGQYTQMHSSFHIYLDDMPNVEIKITAK